jgi:hypothetical protein
LFTGTIEPIFETPPSNVGTKGLTGDIWVIKITL